MTDDIVAFIKARLDEDEAAAQAAAAAPWVLLHGAGNSLISVDPVAIRDEKWRVGHLGHVATVRYQFDAEHIARHDPARVLREVEAKRAILGQHRHQRFAEPLNANSKFEEDRRPAFDEAPRYVGCVECSYDSRYEEVYPSWWCEHVRLLALPYADHPDYSAQWRP